MDDASACRTEAGRFEPGRSGNPGGRPAADQVVRRLSTRRAWGALRLLVEALDQNAELIVIDARGLFAQRADAGSDVRWHDDEPPVADDEVLLRRGRALRRAHHEAAFAADWVAADRQEIGQDGRAATIYGRRKISSGEWVSMWSWYDRCETWVSHQMGLEAIGAAANG